MNRPTLHRRGFTLLEMILVLTIIVAVGAMAVPIFTGTMRIERLRKGVELIAADWVDTQATAMETGETQVWICQIGTAGYSTSTYSNESGLTATEAALLASESTGLSATSGSVSGESDFGKKMPPGVTIQDVLVSEGDSIVNMAQTSANESSSATILFYPDGTSSSARLSVIDEQQRTMTVVMNGLAGTVRILKDVGGETQ